MHWIVENAITFLFIFGILTHFLSPAGLLVVLELFSGRK